MDLFALFSLAVVAGGVSFTSPCTLPLLPGYVSYVSGLSDPWGEGARLAPADRRRVRLGAGLFVLGFTLVFTALGASASALGLLLVRNLAVVNLVGGAVIVVMGLVTAGMLSWTLPGFPLRWGMSARWGRGPGGALPLGAAFAAGWT
ncbi:MAG: cytochrome c biogenesis CcdA family protein, partial [Actinomycetota bacterium]